MSLPCAGCGVCVHRKREYGYMLHDAVWRAIIRRSQRSGRGFSRLDVLCIGCLERDAGRTLQRDDFDWRIPLNTSTRWMRSTRLRARMAVGA